MSGNDGSRVPLVTDRDQVDPQYREHYDRIADTRGSVRGPFGALLNSPVVAGRVAHLGTYLRYESELSGPVRELAILTTAREFECAYEWAAHEPLAREEGLSDPVIDSVAERSPTIDLPDAKSRIVEYGRNLFGENDVSDELFAAVERDLGTKGTIELTATMGYYGTLACVINAVRIRPDGVVPEFA